MKRLTTFLLCTLILALLASCSVEDTILSMPKKVAASGGYVFVQGRWKKTEGNLPHLLGRINSVDIVCEKASMKCTELIAQLDPLDERVSNNTVLFVRQNLYEVVGWSNEMVDARLEANVADLDLRIYVQDRVAHRNWRETKGRGSQTADPKNFEHWELQ